MRDLNEGRIFYLLVWVFLRDVRFFKPVVTQKVPNVAKDDQDALDRIKSVVGKIGDFEKAGFNRTASAKPKEKPEEIFGMLPKSRSDQYDMYEIIN